MPSGGQRSKVPHSSSIIHRHVSITYTNLSICRNIKYKVLIIDAHVYCWNHLAKEYNETRSINCGPRGFDTQQLRMQDLISQYLVLHLPSVLDFGFGVALMRSIVTKLKPHSPLLMLGLVLGVKRQFLFSLLVLVAILKFLLIFCFNVWINLFLFISD